MIYMHIDAPGGKLWPVRMCGARAILSFLHELNVMGVVEKFLASAYLCLKREALNMGVLEWLMIR